MHFPSLVVPALAALAAAQSTTVINVFEAKIENPYYSARYPTSTSVAGSVVGINAEETTYKIACMKGAPKSDCGIDEPYTIIAGPTTFSTSLTSVFSGYGVTATVSENIACSFTHTTESAKCIVTIGVTSGDVTTARSSTKTIPASDVTYMPLTVTGGLSLFNSPQATEAPDAAAGPHRALITAAPLGAAAALAVAALF
ncbi:hypothetical protein N7474_010465 [Penicillium riverlandense]|uniref:uncharacterized protein n=1 Tax=Penicillium riverlandense TaxID=1903569 RepID=UPI00254686F2|nr:uncharacterized protein N7474_010465 [Penicillium riverlandense]KAJ5806873.1 hypothetical protein N7474_010465 [Penicillium riverlandense]